MEKESKPKRAMTSILGSAESSEPKSPAALEAERILRALKETGAFSPAPPKLVK